MSSAYASIGISRLAYRIPSRRLTLEELSAADRLSSPAAVLRDFGFEHCHVLDSCERLDGLIVDAGREALGNGMAVDDVGALYLVSGIDAGDACRTDSPLELFRYPAARAHHELGLNRASALAVSQQGCSGLLSTIDMAARLLASAELPAALCLAGDALPHGSSREIIYNLMGDAAAALLLQRDAPRNRIVAFRQHTQSYYWDTPAREQELLAAYFPVAQRVILATLDAAALTTDDVRWFVPHNVSRRSWQILARLLGVSDERVWTDNIARLGHSISCDHVINLADMTAAGLLSPGDYLALFTFGFGASWSCMVLQH